MADFDIRDIAALKVKLQIIEKLVLADWILIILSMYYDWGGWIASLIGVQIILYAYPDKKDQDIRIDMSYEHKRLTIVITDTGIGFNPLERQEPDLTLSLEERPIGGLGIYLVKQLMTEVSYSRSAGKNILTMTKDIH